VVLLIRGVIAPVLGRRSGFGLGDVGNGYAVAGGVLLSRDAVGVAGSSSGREPAGYHRRMRG